VDDPFDLQRFVAAQDGGGTYRAALDELRQGRKETHWMWFVFPQLRGLGRSPMATRYGIGSLEEAVAYLRHPVLGPRLLACADVVAATERAASEVFGAVDATKLRSSMTLFARAAPEQVVFRLVLDAHFGGQEDPATLARL
jgi:uncharacterized protein (DUF1810 family)